MASNIGWRQTLLCIVQTFQITLGLAILKLFEVDEILNALAFIEDKGIITDEHNAMPFGEVYSDYQKWCFIRLALSAYDRLLHSFSFQVSNSLFVEPAAISPP